METQTQKILTELETLTNGLIYPLTGDAPYKTFCWLLKEKGEFTLEKFLFDVKAIKISNCYEFLNNVRVYSSFESSEVQIKLVSFLWSGHPCPPLCTSSKRETLYSSDLILERYINLIKILENSLASLHFYDYFGIPVMFGYTSDNELIGIAPRVYSTKKHLETILVYPEQTQANQATSVLVGEIQTIIDKLPYKFGDTACPEILFLTLKVLSNRKYIIPGMMIDTHLIDNQDIDDFFRIGNGEGDLPLYDLFNPPKEHRQRELRVREIFKSVLVNSNVYWIHPPHAGYATAYVLGQTPDLDYVGVKIYGWAH